jgi:predicted NAD/FAD-binding protein
MKIAIVGGGIAALGAAWALNRRHEVDVFVADGHAGGHANTVDVPWNGNVVPVDTGFIVYNEPNYPHLTRLFALLDVPTRATDMSFAVSLDEGRLEYEGSLRGLVAQPGNLFNRRFHAMLRDTRRFYREAPALLEATPASEISIGDYLAAGGYSRAFIEDHLLPMGAAIWSCSLRETAAYPARSFVRFFQNHGLLSLSERPQWRTVCGGSRAYVRRLVAPFASRVHLSTPVVGVEREGDVVRVQTWRGEAGPYDAVVFGVHADQALTILGPEATALERQVLGSFRYAPNRAILHQDPALMPRRRRAWASWNYAATTGGDDRRRVAVTYWMNRLQSIDPACPLFVSLNPLREPAPDLVRAGFEYEHPMFDRGAIRAQRLMPFLQGANRTWFCGSYAGYGFHEDALRSGLEVAAMFDAPAPWVADGSVPMRVDGGPAGEDPAMAGARSPANGGRVR